MFIGKKHSNKQQQALRRMTVRAALVLIACMCVDLCAGTTSVHGNLLFTHSFFTGKNWRRTGDTLTYTLPASYTGLKPLSVFMAGSDSINTALFSAADKKLYLMNISLKPAPSYTARPILEAANPSLSAAGSADSVYGLFASSPAGTATLFLATAGATNKIIVRHVIKQDFSVFRTDTLTVPLPSPNCRIKALYGGPALAKGSQSCIWAVGTHGLVRFFAWNGSAWASPVSYNIDTSQTVSAFSLEAVGTLSGAIYTAVSNSFVFNSRPCSTSVNRISSLGAVCNSGIVLKRKTGNVWQRFNAGSRPFRYFNFVPRTDGSGIEVLDDSLKYHIYTLEDTLTSFTILPAKIAAYINSGAYYYAGNIPETVTVNLNDPDGNYQVPQITHNNTFSFTVSGTDTIRQAHPDTACVTGFTDLADTSLFVVLRPDSVVFFTKARRAAYNAISYKYYWVYPVFRTSRKWAKSEPIKIKLGTRELNIIYNISTESPWQYNNNTWMNAIGIHKNRSALILKFPQNKIESIRIYNPKGRMLASVPVDPANESASIPGAYSSGVVLFEFQLHNGSVVRKACTFLR